MGFEGGRTHHLRALCLVALCISIASLAALQLDAVANPNKGGKHRRDRHERRHHHRRHRDNRHKRTRYHLPVAHKWVTEKSMRSWHHDYPAWDLPIPMGRKVMAVTAGRVTSVTRWGACGRGVIARGKDGFTYTYCHGSALKVHRGSRLWPGRTILRSGNSGSSTGPHVHLQIKKKGKLICPQPLLVSWERGRPRSPHKSRSHGCFYGGGALRWRWERIADRQRDHQRHGRKDDAKKGRKRHGKKNRRHNHNKSDRNNERRGNHESSRRNGRNHDRGIAGASPLK